MSQMEIEIPKQEFSIRKLGTKSVTLYPTKAQVVRNINGVLLKPGPNQIIITGLTPTCDEHSIKVDGTGSATITDLIIDLVKNPEVYADVYPDETEQDGHESTESEAEKTTENGRLTEIYQEIQNLEGERIQHTEILNSAKARLAMIDLYLTNQAGAKNEIVLSAVLDSYRNERAKIFEERTVAAKKEEKITEKIGTLQKEVSRISRIAKKAQEKAARQNAKLREKEERMRQEKREKIARIHKERVKFWPKKVFKITISIEASSGFTPSSSRRNSIDSLSKVPEAPKPDVELDTAEVNLSISYITYSASWTPRYDLSLNTVNNTGMLDYSAELTNVTSETWRDAKVILSTPQSSYQGLSDTIPTLNPWRIRLTKGNIQPAANAALQSFYEIHQSQQNRKELPSQVYQPRHELFGVEDIQLTLDRITNKKVLQCASTQRERHDYQANHSKANRKSYAMEEPMSFSMADPPAPPPPLSSALLGGMPLKSKKKATSAKSFGITQSRRTMAEGLDEDDESESDEISKGDIDGATLGGFTEPALLFEESSFEESGLTTTYDLPSFKTLVPASTKTKHKIARVEFKAVAFSHIIIPKLRAAAFFKAKLRNTSKITLLKGSAGLTVDGSFLGQSTIPRCSSGETFTLNLGTDPAVTVGYARPTVQRSSSGLFSKENCEVFTRVATITNTKSNTIVELTLLEQVPVSEDERLKIDILTPRGLRVGGDAVGAGVPKDGDKPRETAVSAPAAGASSASVVRAGVYSKDVKWGSAVATAKKGGEINFNVKINPGRGCKLVLDYEATYPGGETVVHA